MREYKKGKYSIIVDTTKDIENLEDIGRCRVRLKEVEEEVIENFFNFENIGKKLTKQNNVVYCYSVDDYMSYKQQDKKALNKDKAILGITLSGIVITTQDLNIFKELVFKVRKKRKG